MNTASEAKACKKMWCAVVCLAINDGIKPFWLAFEHGEDYKKMFARQYKKFCKRKQNPFDMPDKINTGEPLALAKRKARVWFEARSQDFLNVCDYAGFDDPDKIAAEAMEMFRLVDEYEKKHVIFRGQRDQGTR